MLKRVISDIFNGLKRVRCEKGINGCNALISLIWLLEIYFTTSFRTINRLFLHFSSYSSVCASNDTLVTFDGRNNSSLAIVSEYFNINWANGYYTTSISGNNSLYGVIELPVTMTSANGYMFTLNSVIAAAWYGTTTYNWSWLVITPVLLFEARHSLFRSLQRPILILVDIEDWNP